MRVIFVALFMVLGLGSFGQGPVKDFVDDYAEKRSFFLYQSTLRSFNDKTSSDFNKLIKDVDKISIHLLPQNTVEQSAVLGLISSLENDGFKIMNSISKKEEGIYFYTHKERSDKTTIGIFYKKGYAGVVQLDGAIDMKYVGALKQMNPEKIGDFFGFDDLKKQFEENQNENGNE